MTVNVPVKLTLEKAIKEKLRRMEKAINDGLDKSFKKTFNTNKRAKEYYSRPSSNRSTLKQKASGKTPNELRALYVEAWRRTYQVITESYAQSERWEKTKRSQIARGKSAPYGLSASDFSRLSKSKQKLGLYEGADPRYRVKYSGTGLYTGFLRRSVEKGFANGGNKYLTMLGDDLVLGYQVNVDKFPFYNDKPYVERYLEFLKKKTGKDAEELFSFSDSDKTKIANYMVKLMQTVFIPEFEEELSKLADKVK